MRRPDSSAIIGFLLFILVIVSVTAAIIMYKHYNVQSILLYSVVGLAILFVIGVLFTGIQVPGPRATEILSRIKQLCIVSI